MTKVDIVQTPVENCQNCNSKRVGIQEGRIFFRCNSIFDTNAKRWSIYVKCFRLAQAQKEIIGK